MEDEADEKEGTPVPDSYDVERVRKEKSLGVVSDSHWTRTRADLHHEELEFLRERSRAPGVAEGGAERNQYCMECHGVIPLHYDSRESAADAPTENCPHCGAEIDPAIRQMFNWVEIDQVPSSDLRALLPFALGGMAIVFTLGMVLWWMLTD